eukprot:399431-Amphidinium_carterae.1
MDSQALTIARLTAGLRSYGQDRETYKDSARFLREKLGVKNLTWSKRLLALQGQLIGHCLRQPRENPECSTLLWRNREWHGIYQNNQGRRTTLADWWAKPLPISVTLHEAAQDRLNWRSCIRNSVLKEDGDVFGLGVA